ncbi:MAG TPA: lactate utilization protein [Spirochaetia bacterium]|nr:lactate utilization protein [Spirochaetia bacterium]
MTDLGRFYGERAKKVVAALNKNLFEGVYAPTAREAVDEILKRVPEGSTVSAGGSVTLRQIGILELLRQQGHTVFDHWQEGLDAAQVYQVRRSQLTADVFLSSTNAVTLDGRLVNIDGAGNRVAAMIFGPSRVIVVAGINKVTRDQESALARIRDEAAPLNMYRLDLPTPCAKTTFCANCAPPARMCRITTVIEAKPLGIPEFTVIVVGEPLGY